MSAIPAIKALIDIAYKRSFPPRADILHPGGPSLKLYVILEGSVAVIAHDSKGHEIVLGYLGPGEFFGELSLLPDPPPQPSVTVRARRATLVAEIGRDSFRQFVLRRPDVLLHLTTQLARRLSDAGRQIRELAFVDVSGRISNALLDLARQPDAQVHARGMLVRSSRMELARRVGCSREMAGRILKKLAEDGVVQAYRGSLLLVGVSRDTLDD